MSQSPIDRRAFVKASAATAATAFLLSRAGAQGNAQGAAAALATKLDPIKVGLLGCGGRGTGAASDAMNADSGVVIHSMGDILNDRLEGSVENLAKDFPGRFNVPKERRFLGFDALDKVLASGIDVIFLATPPHWRPTQIRASLDAGKHVFAEKPMAVDAVGIRSVIESAKLAKQKNLSLMSGFCWRSSSAEREIYKRVLDGQIGAIRTVYATYNGSPNGFVERKPKMSDMEWQIRNWYHYLWLGGDHIVEQAVHSVDKINWAMNNEPPKHCWAVGGRAQRTSEHPGNIFDHHSVTYEWPDGRRAFLMARQWENCPNDNTDYVYGEKGVAFISGWVPRHEIKGEKPWIYDGDHNAMYVEEHMDLFRGIRSGKHRFDGDWMVNSTLMAIMGRMASYTGQMVTWDQALNSVERYGPDKYAFGDVAVTPVPRPGFTRFS